MALLPRGCSSPQLPASIGGLDTRVSLRWSLARSPVRLPAVSLSRNEGRPYHRLRCFIAGVFGWSLVTRRRHFYQGCHAASAARRATPTRINVEWPSRQTCLLRRILVLVRRRPGGARPLPWRTRGCAKPQCTVRFVGCWGRLRPILLRTPVPKTGLAICEGKGYVEPQNVVGLCRRKATWRGRGIVRSPRVLALVRRRPGGSRPP